ncbi:MAG TPA: peroxiredoxin [Polyangiaceae bacterium]|jgi:peroxiredoxin Q/BCP
MRTLFASSALALLLASLAACAESSPPPAAAPTATTTTAAPSSTVAATPPPAPTAVSPAATAPAAAAMPAPPAADLAVGQTAPDFTAADQDGKPVHLADLKGHSVVVYFYPKDETPGCTHEACSFRDAWVDLKKKGVVIIGISTDNQASHKAFAEHHKLPFVLVSDPNGDIAKKYGVPVEEGFTKRQSFVLAPDGTLKKIYRKVDVTKHAQEIAQDTAS